MNDYDKIWFGQQYSNTTQSAKNDCLRLAQLPLNNLEESLMIPFLFTFSSISVISTLLNLTTFILYFKSAHLKGKRSIKLLLSLAVSDLLVGMVVAPVSIAQILLKNISQCHFINIIAKASHIILILVLMIMCTITLEQYLKIVKQDVYQQVLTSCRFKVFLAAPWIISSLVLVIGVISSVTAVLIVVVAWLILFFIIFLMYWRIYIHLQNRQKLWNIEENSHVLAAIHKQNKRSTTMMLLLVMGIAFCYILGYSSKAVHVLEYYQIGEFPWLHTWRKYYLGITANILQQSNSILNPILYNCRSTEFSKALKEIAVKVKNAICCRSGTSSKTSKRDTVRLGTVSSYIQESSKLSASAKKNRRNVIDVIESAL